MGPCGARRGTAQPREQLSQSYPNCTRSTSAASLPAPPPPTPASTTFLHTTTQNLPLEYILPPPSGSPPRRLQGAAAVFTQHSSQRRRQAGWSRARGDLSGVLCLLAISGSDLAGEFNPAGNFTSDAILCSGGRSVSRLQGGAASREGQGVFRGGVIVGCGGGEGEGLRGGGRGIWQRDGEAWTGGRLRSGCWRRSWRATGCCGRASACAGRGVGGGAGRGRGERVRGGGGDVVVLGFDLDGRGWSWMARRGD
ncbi:hypothetical protein KC19_3G150500 [Ceratodon purpureus]|uniref:Uncharacterized protein n=1 Tax=Ceratodon purpureus TaxID=3225 RepID=A0A8T0IK30_CERPU|nr:hypothetical protein KC19_3G150500 [Ceratodon purpureus]